MTAYLDSLDISVKQVLTALHDSLEYLRRNVQIYKSNKINKSNKQQKQTNKQNNPPPQKKPKTKQTKTTLTGPSSNLKNRIHEGKIHTTNTHIHDRSLSWFVTGTSIKHIGVKLILWTETFGLFLVK